MRLNAETRRRSVLPLLAGVLGALYLFVFVPMDRRTKSLAVPLEQSWRRLAAGLGKTNALELDFLGLTNQLQATQAASVALKSAREQVRTRVQLDADLRAQLNEPFFFVDYRYEKGRRIDGLARLAKQQGVVLEPAVLNGFPEPSATMQEPALLWAELAFLESLLTTAINAKVGTIHLIAATTSPMYGASTNNGSALAELPLQIELTGPTPNVARFLQTLPLRAEEIAAAGLPAAPTNKPALFIDGIVLRKQSPEKLDEVRLSLHAVGFVFKEMNER